MLSHQNSCPDARCLAAVAYAERGWFVVPLHGINDAGTCTCRKHRHCGHAGKHPFGRLALHGSKDASRRPEVVDRWFSIYRWLNVGIVPGPSGLVVIDQDPRNGGHESLARLLDEVGGMPDTLTAATGGGGWHYYFRDTDCRARSRLIDDGLEVKAGRSLLVAPPSRHKSGCDYRWLDPDAPVAPAPEWLFSRSEP